MYETQGCNSGSCGEGGDCKDGDPYKDIGDGYDADCCGNHVGSLIVNPGCTFYGFGECFFGGTVYEYNAGELDTC